MTTSDISAEHRFAIIDIYNAYAEGIDSKDWTLVRSCFADEVYLEYGDLSAAIGGPDAPCKADDWILALQSVINGFDLTRHTITNHRFRRCQEGVECRAYLVADHVIFAQEGDPNPGPEELSTLVGEYTNVCRETANGWQVVRSQLTTTFTTGNDGLFVLAMERAAATGS